MKIILVLVLGISLYPSSKTQGGLPSEIICDIAGRIWSTTFPFDISVIPEDCGILNVAQYFFDLYDDGNTNFWDSDKDLVTKLTNAGRTVYTRIGFMYNNNTDWSLAFGPNVDPTKFQTQTIDPLVKFLNTYKISGIILNMEYDFAGFSSYSKKISDLVTKIKQSVKHDLKFGLIVPTWPYFNYSAYYEFDFKTTNQVLDFYIVDVSALNICDSDGKKYGIVPITCTDPDMITMDQITTAATNSSMDKSKVYAKLGALGMVPVDEMINNKTIISLTYYCLKKDSNSNSSKWCVNPTEFSYNQSVYAKQHYKGIVIEQLDTDDYNNSCSCGPFPETNAYISGWKSSSVTTCSNFGNNLQT